ncbi:hypothetical protein D5400_01245 [Georhizobium profundi]|uniref:Uncharacterized protein n=1 Tax=Georhizobium profundi TaxID=2341112 RepID=A0A3Q8XNI5_9HYPH|nr:hypothetical protein D5400_01245 [Georhizobium profundi]
MLLPRGLAVRLIALPLLLATSIALSACASTGETEPENLPAAERAGIMERLGTSLSTACGPTAGCYGLAVRLAGFLWEYRESFSVQTRVYRCVGQYALGAGYRWGVRRFVSEIDNEAQATSMVTYLYECAVPEWARAWFDGQEDEPPVPPGEVAPPPGQVRTRPATIPPVTTAPTTPAALMPATPASPAANTPGIAPAAPATPAAAASSPQQPAGVRRNPAPATTRPTGTSEPAPVVGPPMPPSGAAARARAASPAASEIPAAPRPQTTAPIRPSPATVP